VSDYESRRAALDANRLFEELSRYSPTEDHTHDGRALKARSRTVC